MSGGLGHDAILGGSLQEAGHPATGLARAVAALNRIAFNVSGLALLAAALVLTFGVLAGHLTGRSVIWQDEVMIFLVSGAMFLSAAAVQSARGHVGIEIVQHMFPDGAIPLRIVVDAVVFAFCAIFAWESATLLREAIQEGQITESIWGPPLWIPYLLLAVGMTLLAVQVGLQTAENPTSPLASRRSPWSPSCCGSARRCHCFRASRNGPSASPIAWRRSSSCSRACRSPSRSASSRSGS